MNKRNRRERERLMLFTEISDLNKNRTVVLAEDGSIYTMGAEKASEFEAELRKKESDLDCALSFSDKRLKKIVILLTDKCNLRCRYCYLDYGNYENKECLSNISVSDVTGILDVIYRRFPEGIGYIQFFGGEPLIAYGEIKEIVRYIKETCREQGCELPKYGLVSNGLLLDEKKMNFFDENHVEVMISMDGDAAIHDAVRFGINRTSTFEKIAENVCTLTKTHKLFFEMTLNRTHILAYRDGIVREWLDTLKSLGFAAGNVGIIEMSKDPALDLLPEDFPVFQKIEADIIDYFFKEFDKPDAMYHIDIFRVLMRLLRKQTNAYSCGAGISQLTVSTDGKILPCPKYAGLGFDMEISDTAWDNSRIAEVVWNEYKTGCQGCWARQLCIGYCYSLKYRNKANDRNLLGRCWHVREMNRNIAQQIVWFKESGRLPVLIENIHKFDTVIKKYEE